jgi:dTDP-4-dehydrorhamnose 3,5-epimerase
LSRFTVHDLPLAGLKLVERQRISDARGFLSRMFCRDELEAHGWNQPIAQINHTCTTRTGTIRGMHFQLPPWSEVKLVSCLRGEIWDVAVDIRAGSKTFLQWHAERLSADNGRALLIPAGFAHGFQTLSDDVELLYCHSAPFNAAFEAGLNAADPTLAIGWPLAITEISARDREHPMLNGQFAGVKL